MKTFLVTVYSAYISIDEWQTKSEKQPDCLALVDGDRWQYFIARHEHTNKKSGWRSRGLNHAYYHVLNSGNVIKWVQVVQQEPTRKKEISDKQVALF